MKIIDNILYLEFCEMLSAGIKEDTVKKAIQRGSFASINDPDDRRRVLIGYDRLRNEYKEKIHRVFGNPYEFVAKEPIRKMVQKDFKAEEFFLNYRYNGPTGNDRLKPEVATRYTHEASWLNMLVQADDNKKKIIKDGLKLDVNTFYSHVTALLNAEKQAGRVGNVFPTAYKNLLPKMKEYRYEGYPVLIDKRFGNKHAAKVGLTETGYDAELHEKQIALIRTAASKHNNFDAAQVTALCNPVFIKNGWPAIGKSTVYNIMQANKHLITAGRQGTKAHNTNIARHVLRQRPAYPLYYCTLDGWTAELLYQDANGYNNRLVIVVVLDPMNNYPVGYAIGERENSQLIRQALRNAIVHINDLFGGYYRPHQLQSDNYALKNLTPFYEAVAHLHTPAAVGNAKSKVVEPYFKYLNKTYCQTQLNWSGSNITSRKENQVNTEYLNKIKTQFPDRGGVVGQLEYMMAEERRKKGAEYFAQWQAMPETDRLGMPRENYYMVFGQKTGFTNSITGKGLCPTIGGKQLVYDTFEPAFREHQHLAYTVLYDDNDLSEVLAVSECGKHQFLLQQTRRIAMDIKSSTAADHDYRAQITAQNKALRTQVMQTYVNDALLVEEVISNTPFELTDANEAALKLMFTKNGQQKEGIQNAKGLKNVQKKQLQLVAKEEEKEARDWATIQAEYLKSKVDISKYL